MTTKNGDIVTVNEARRALRTELINARQRLSVGERSKLDLSLRTAVKFCIDCRPDKPTSIALYWPIRGEPDLMPLAHELIDAGFVVLLPVVAEKSAPLAFAPYTKETKLKRGAYQIIEPELPIDAALKPDLVVIPCVGFNQDKYRLGYGGGYYDRTLAKWRHEGLSVFTLGVAYEFARVEFEAGSHDLPLDEIVFV